MSTHLDAVFVRLGISARYELDGRTFYDLGPSFGRHNFARDLKRKVEERDWLLEKTKYYVSKQGIICLAFTKTTRNKAIIDAVMALDTPLPELARKPDDLTVAVSPPPKILPPTVVLPPPNQMFIPNNNYYFHPYYEKYMFPADWNVANGVNYQ